MKQTWIGLLDCNNFFVSCERLFRPDLKGKPVIVLSSNDGCVVARSQEIKDMGVPMGVPYFKIKDIIKDTGAVTFSSQFALYRDISRRVFEVMRTELDLVEQYSIDEAFFSCVGTKAEMEVIMKSLKDKVERYVGIPVSVGVADSKTQAKYASKLAKKTGGEYVMTRDKWGSQIQTIRLGEIWGVGYKLAERYKTYNIKTVFELLQFPRGRVKQLFGEGGVRVWSELQGIVIDTVQLKSGTQKSLMSSRSFKKSSEDKEVIKDAIAYHVQAVASDLRSMGLKTVVMRVFIAPSRHGDFLLQGGSKEAVLTNPTNDTFTLLNIAQGLVDKLYLPHVPYKKVGVVLSALVPEVTEQLGLFSDQGDEKTQTLMTVVDTLNRSLGRGKVSIGSRLRSEKWGASASRQSPGYTTQWTDLAVVKAR